MCHDSPLTDAQQHKLQIVPQICICDACRPSTSNWLPSADDPFGAKSQYGLSTDQLSLRPTTQNRTRPPRRRQSTQCQCPCNVPLRPSREHVHNMAGPRSSHHGSMSNDTSMLAMRLSGAPRRVATCGRGRFARARPRTHLHQVPARSRSPQQQAEHAHLFVATRLVAEQFEQQRAAENRNAERSRAPTSRSDAPSRRSVTFTQRSTRAAAGVGPTTSRNAPPLLPLSATQHTVVLTYLLTVFRTPPQTTHANVGDLHTQL